MKKRDVKISGVYIAKVTNKLVQVRIDAVSKYGGWTAINLATQKSVRIRSASRLRGEAGEQKKAGNKKTKRNGKPATMAGGDQRAAHTLVGTTEPALKAKTVPNACPNCGDTEIDEDGDCVKCHEPEVAGKTAEAQATVRPRSLKDRRANPKRLSGLDAAAKVLADTGVPMNVKEIVAVAFVKGYWKPAGRTPSATLAAALIREIAKKGSQARFCKSERGKFVLNR